MMDINPNSYYFRNVLLYHYSSKYNYPKTVCALAFRVLWTHLIYAIFLFTMSMNLYSAATTGSFFYRTDNFTLVSAIINLCNAFIIVVPICILVFVLVCLVFKGFDVLNTLSRVAINAIRKEPLTEDKSTIVHFVEGVYTRFKQKTCTLINYKS